ncbi:DNA circularization N-terminal domain-containing protein [Pseudomonas sp. GD03860]|uniref:DNA circularization protein n=1 Tax=Pseudomonas sp. GD03860 TaxID=2975389 RepID=UPI00244A32E4|nr:DNA circularization N-terminal domain-containing protein [Pseudomonas sp. GD03860]MDH0640615.1 DNA circularization N-terminal domain-containing protein [Pseudomonas sp. GD03860]
MGWRDNYRAASFRGVPFFVESADSTHGRRQAVHEHAQRDVPYTEDLGRKAREFSVSGYLIGLDYQAQRDKLIEACETAGPGVLVHPYRGELTVVCRGLGLSESTNDGGMCLVKLTFLEAGEASYPSAKIDSINAISAKGNAVTAAAEQGFLSDFLTTGFPAYVAESAAKGLADLGEFMAAPGLNFAGDLQAASDFYLQAKGLASDAFSLVQKPLQMVSRITGLFGSVRMAFGSNAFSMLTSLFDRSPASYSGSTATPSRQQQATNHLALNALVRQVAVAEAAKAAVVTQKPLITAGGAALAQRPSTLSVSGPVSSTPTSSPPTVNTPTVYDSYQEAVKVREELVGRIDAESEATPVDEVYVALSDLRTSVVQAVPNKEQDLPRIVPYMPKETLPSLLVAYQIYGDAGRADEIAARNTPRHPGFLMGGTKLEVLADG